jgi:myosin V
MSTTTTTTTTTTSTSTSSTTRVWIQKHAVDAIRNPKSTWKFNSSTTSTGILSTASNSRPTTTLNCQDSSTPAQISSYPWSIRKSQSTLSDVDSCSDISSSVGTVITPTALNMARTQSWTWMGGILVSQTLTLITIQLDPEHSLSDSSLTIPSDSSSLVLSLPIQALQDGTIVLDNVYDQPPHDCITLTHLHEPAVVQCLLQRYQTDLIYTATGPVLLALNPFKTIPRLYGDSTMKRYWEKAEHNTKTELPPHVYQIADRAFRSMMRNLELKLSLPVDTTPVSSESVTTPMTSANQAILVSGESGAGKTVTTKFVMKYLAALSQRASAPRIPEQRAYRKVQENQRAAATPKNSNNMTSMARTETMVFSSNSIESKVLQSNPILESFGNARTLRNDNSSRFGKFMELQFTQTGCLVGATMETYLLEQVRLVSASSGERNYHIFYEMLRGMEAKELRQYYIAATATPDDFFILQGNTHSRRDGVSDAETYRALRTAMTTMSLQSQEQTHIFSVTAALLHLSNLTFIEQQHQPQQAASGNTKNTSCALPAALLETQNVHLGPACRLLGITPVALNEALCTFSIQAGREGHVKTPLDRNKAEKCLKALIKATYGAMFQYLVMRINDSIAYNPEGDEERAENKPVATIGILDIFGFESFTINSFEQLCINYCNEALQQQFNAFVLKNEQAEYEREGIEWSFIEFPENQDVLDLIDKRGSGILNILDDQCRAPGTTDRSFAADVYAKCTSHLRFRANRRQVAGLQFEIHHYAGYVEYSTDGFVEKNRDELHNELSIVLAGSASPFVSFLSEFLIRDDAAKPNKLTEDSNPDNPTKMFRRTDSGTKRATVGGQFRSQLRGLRSKIDQTSPHYVRCLKPNDRLVPDYFDTGIVAEQLRCGGILEAIRVSRAGFPQHYPHAEFYMRYHCIGTTVMKKAKTQERNSWSSNSSSSSWTPPVPQKKWQPPRSNAFQSSQSPRSELNGGVTQGSKHQRSRKNRPTENVNYKESCKELLNVICRKIQALEIEENKENGESTENCENSLPNQKEQQQPVIVKAKSYTSPPSQAPSWSKNHDAISNSKDTAAVQGVRSKVRGYATWNKPETVESSSSTTPRNSSCGMSQNGIANFRRGTIDLAKFGMQLGTTKVFLRHTAFETLERIRSRELTIAATKLNSLFRMYLSRIAYLPVRDAYRAEMESMMGMMTQFSNQETKGRNQNFGPSSTSRAAVASNSAKASRLIAIFESSVRASIHSPMLWSKQGRGKLSSPPKPFQWVLEDGIWVKNPIFLLNSQESSSMSTRRRTMSQ